MPVSERLLTGVDQLLSLVQSKGKISIEDAARELGVGKTIVQEWAEFLEEEGLVKLEYKLSKVFITSKIHKKLTESKVKELNLKKQAFLAKVETAIQNIEEEARSLSKALEELGNAKEIFGSKLASIKKELEELEEYHKLKRELAIDIEKEKEHLTKMLQALKQQEVSEEKALQEKLSQELEVEKKLRDEEVKLRREEEKLENLRQQIKALKSVIEEVDKKTAEELEKLRTSEKNVKNLEDYIKKSVSKLSEMQKSKIAELEKKHKAFEEKISKFEKELLNKIRLENEKIAKEVSEESSSVKKLEELLVKKAKIETFLTNLALDLEKLRREFNNLARKAIIVESLKKTSDFKQVEKSFKELEKKRKELELKASQFLSKI
ncbi:hypothetical protein J7L02_03880 [Candidatus Woesearchaeota archaeon]|nr:hypothetical protein [Candidatus Woesearchaeota archaeon]